MMCHHLAPLPSVPSQAPPAGELSGTKGKATSHPAKKLERTTQPMDQDAVFGGD